MKERRPNNRKNHSQVRHAHEIGRYKEGLAMRALHCMLLPSWIRDYSRCSREEDMNGKDLRILTDMGDVFIQIKSSMEGVEKYLKRGPRKFPVAIVIIEEGENLENVGQRILKAAEGLRNELYQETMHSMAS
ncbi:MAG: hypothetical protein PHW63_10870 [Alphaproteobacteria bacterium]|nr:hypothetical protein [Alphaproteobacteria bacterium]